MSDDTMDLTVDAFSGPNELDEFAAGEPEPVTEEQKLESCRQQIAFWSKMRGECSECDVKSYDWLYREHGGKEAPLSQHLEAERWEHLTDRAGAIRRCAHHEPLYPWAADLDPVRVCDYIAAQCAKHGGGAFAIDFEELRKSCM